MNDLALAILGTQNDSVGFNVSKKLLIIEMNGYTKVYGWELQIYVHEVHYNVMCNL